MTVPQAICGAVVLPVLQTEDLLDVLYLDILDDLVVTGFSDIQELSSERKDTVLVSSDHTET